MERLDPSLVLSPIPSLSPLSGTIRPSTANAAVEESWRQLNRKPNRRWVYGVPPPATPGGPQQAGEQVGSLASAAKQHVSSIGKGAAAPYRRALTPQEKFDIEKRVSKQVEVLSKVLQEAQVTATEKQQAVPSQPQGPGDVSRPLTPQQVVAAIKELLDSRPASRMSVQDVTLPRPSSKQGRPAPIPLAAEAPPGGGPWAGSLPTTPNGAPRTPKRLGSRGGPLRASAPAPLGLPISSGAPQEVWVNPLSRAGASEEQRDRALLRSSMGNAAAAHATGSASSAVAAAAATARLLARKSIVPGALPTDQQAAQLLAASRPATASPALGGEVGGDADARPSIREMVQALTQKPLGAPGNPRWGPGQPLEQFVPTRGLVYSVFSELDPGDSGKLTFSAFEEACVLCGLRKEQSAKLFSTLDPAGRGYFTIRDWGSKEHEKQVAEFTRLYIQTTRGATGRPLGVREMKSVALALQVALHRLQIKNHGRVVSKDKLMHAFEFMDTDGSGALSLEEVQDAFNAMSIYVTPEVLTEIMEKFDANRNGIIEYREFLGALYPVLSRAM